MIAFSQNAHLYISVPDGHLTMWQHGSLKLIAYKTYLAFLTPIQYCISCLKKSHLLCLVASAKIPFDPAFSLPSPTTIKEYHCFYLKYMTEHFTFLPLLWYRSCRGSIYQLGHSTNILTILCIIFYSFIKQLFKESLQII